MNGNSNNNQSSFQPEPNNGNSTNLPPPEHALPPRPSLPPWVIQNTSIINNNMIGEDQRAEAYPQESAPHHHQRPAPGQLPNQPGFFTGNLPLSHSHRGTPFAGSFGIAQPGLLNGNHSLSHWFTGQGPFNNNTNTNSVPPERPQPAKASLPFVFTDDFPPPPPPPPPMVGGAANATLQSSGQIPPPPPDFPHFAQPTSNMTRPRAIAPQSDGAANLYGLKEKKKDPKIYLPAPIPTHQYLRQASLQAEVRFPPSRKLVVLDLNGTLLYRPNSRKQPRKMIARPFLKQFLAYLFDNFAVMVWSSAKPENVNVLVEIGLEEYRHRLIACWARDTLGLEPKHYSLNVQCYKDLHRIWASNDIQRHMHGYQSGARFDQRNTILVDDSSLKAAAQPHNLLEIPEFKGVDANIPVQDVLSEVVGYLEVLKMQEDVSKFIHKDPFRANGDWRVDWNDLALDSLQQHFSSNSNFPAR